MQTRLTAIKNPLPLAWRYAFLISVNFVVQYFVYSIKCGMYEFSETFETLSRVSYSHHKRVSQSLNENAEDEEAAEIGMNINASGENEEEREREEEKAKAPRKRILVGSRRPHTTSRRSLRRKFCTWTKSTKTLSLRT